MNKRHPRIDREEKTVAAMIRLYCSGHHTGRALCADCRALLDYARESLIKCPFQDGKTVCSLCAIHCYCPEMREKIRTVMRYSGPRMLTRHPVMAIQYILDRRRKTPLKRPGIPVPKIV